MANGDLLEEVEALLAKRQIPVASALRVSLKLQSQTLEKVNQLEISHANLRTRMDEMEKISIIRWAGAHPKMAVLAVVLIIIIPSMIDGQAIVDWLVKVSQLARWL